MVHLKVHPLNVVWSALILIVGVHAVLMRLWGSKSGPCMQVLHFSWAFGAFVAPLIAKHFIHEPDDDSDKMSYNMTCSDFWTNLSAPTVSVTTPPPLPGITLDCFLLFAEVCQDLTNLSVEEAEEPILADLNCTSTSTVEPPSQFKYAYFIAASLFVPSLSAFIFYAIRRECYGRCCHKRMSTQMAVEQQELANTEAPSSEEERSGQPSRCYTITLFSLIFCFVFLYVGLEAGFGSLIFTVAVTGQLGFHKSTAAVLQSVYWGTFAFTRMISVTFALLKVRASVMITGNLFGSLVASLILTFYIHNSIAIWIGSAVLGMSYASIFPTVMTWMSENAKATGKATAVIVTAGTVGDITLPAVMGALVAKVSPDSLIYFTLIGVIISAATAAVMFLTACLQKRRQASVHDRNPTLKMKKYRRLLAGDTDPLFEDGQDLNDVSENCNVSGDTALVITEPSTDSEKLL